MIGNVLDTFGFVLDMFRDGLDTEEMDQRSVHLFSDVARMPMRSREDGVQMKQTFL